MPGVTDKEISKDPCKYCKYRRKVFSLVFVLFCKKSCAKQGGVVDNFVFNDKDYWKISPGCVEEFVVDSKVEQIPRKKKTKFSFIYGDD